MWQINVLAALQVINMIAMALMGKRIADLEHNRP